MGKMYINSGDLKSVSYDESAMTLDVEFLNNEVYRYSQVPMDTYRGMLNASSKSRYFEDTIKHAFDKMKL